MNQLSYDEKVLMVRQRYKNGKDIYTYMTERRK